MSRIREGDKLYLVTRSDLSPGYRAVQACHALRQFVAEHPDVDQAWFNVSNYIALLEVNNEDELKYLQRCAHNDNLRTAGFYEPDVNYELTAIAIEPCNAARQLCKQLPLALK